MLIFLLLNLNSDRRTVETFFFFNGNFQNALYKELAQSSCVLTARRKTSWILTQSSCVFTTRGKSPWKVGVASCALTARRKTPRKIDIVFLYSHCKSKIFLENKRSFLCSCFKSRNLLRKLVYFASCACSCFKSRNLLRKLVQLAVLLPQEQNVLGKLTQSSCV